MMHFPIVERASPTGSLGLRFMRPTRFKWWADLKVAAYTWWHEGADVLVISRVVDEERAQFLLASYAEWVLRENVRRAEATCS